ncbi:MAG: flagellar hook-associated protein 3 [Treponema sp.]|jgi:flagellar hook-associated protein 3 FlgL|nr:flagellar hook-associated protein 3 [Treponema sp.]
MRRIATDMPNADIQYYLRRQEEGLSNMQSQITSGSRIRELRDDPLAASHAVRYESYLARLERFEKNALYASDHYNAAFNYMNEANSVLQRIRELAVTGANGTYSGDDLKLMGVEINELLKELTALSNKVGPDTRQIFAGDKVFTEPFRVVEGTVSGGGENMVVRVEYRGAGASRKTEISDQAYLNLDIGGGEVFWAEKMQIFSSVDATDYRVNAPGAFFIDGVEINVSAGDTLPAIVAKINDSPAPVKAYVDPETRGLVLEGTNAHLIRAEDSAEEPEPRAAVLRDLGIIRGNMENNAPNWNTSARVAGGSMFDMVIRLRDAMFRGDQEFIGSQGIAGMDLALGNLGSRIAEIGSRQERAEMAWVRLNQEIPDLASGLARESSVNMADAATDLKMMQFAHQASLQTAARILPQTLLDFLR